MNKELRCPHCFRPSVVWEDTLDVGECIIDHKPAYSEYCVGYCENCGRSIEWEKCYTFIGFRREKVFNEE